MENFIIVDLLVKQIIKKLYQVETTDDNEKMQKIIAVYESITREAEDENFHMTE